MSAAFDINNLGKFFEDTKHQVPPEIPLELWAGTISQIAATMTAKVLVAPTRKEKVLALTVLSTYLHGEVGPGLKNLKEYLAGLDQEKIPTEQKAGFSDVDFHLNLSATLLVTYSQVIHEAALTLQRGE
jgi:hypothetical protein